MPPELLHFISHYGYASVFLLVFIQELGIPTFPNEITLIYFGYIVFLGLLKLQLVIAFAILADFTGTCLVYFLFYFFSSFIKMHKPHWLPVPHKAINYIKSKIKRGNKKNILAGRLTPYLRGYISIVYGLLKVSPGSYVQMVLLSAFIWSGGYVLLGYFLGPDWHKITGHLGMLNHALFLIPLLLVLYFIIRYFFKKNLLKSN